MFTELIAVFLCASAGSVLGFFAFSRGIRQRVFNLEIELADLQERHLRFVRKAAARERWSADDELNSQLESLVQKTPDKKKGWRKWASKSENSSDESQQAS